MIKNEHKHAVVEKDKLLAYLAAVPTSFEIRALVVKNTGAYISSCRAYENVFFFSTRIKIFAKNEFLQRQAFCISSCSSYLVFYSCMKRATRAFSAAGRGYAEQFSAHRMHRPERTGKLHSSRGRLGKESRQASPRGATPQKKQSCDLLYLSSPPTRRPMA